MNKEKFMELMEEAENASSAPLINEKDKEAEEACKKLFEQSRE